MPRARQSKLANILFSTELAKRWQAKGITSNALHPGVVATRFASNTPDALNLFYKLGAPFMLSPQKGAETILFLASSPTVEGVSGKYFAKCKAVVPSKQARDPAAAAMLWQRSEELIAQTFAPNRQSRAATAGQRP